MVKTEREIKVGRPLLFNENDKDEIVINFNKGENLEELAKEFNCSARTIRRILKERSD